MAHPYVGLEIIWFVCCEFERRLCLKVMQLEEKIMREERVELPKHLRQRLVDEIHSRLRSSDAAGNATRQGKNLFLM